MTSLTHLENLRSRGPKTRFLINTSYAKIFPVLFDEKFFYINKEKKILQKIFYINLYLNMEYVFQFTITLGRTSFFKTKKDNSFHVSVEPLYEYGNEEEYLPPKDFFTIIKTNDELLNFLKSTLEQHLLKNEEKQTFFRLFNKALYGNKHSSMEEEYLRMALKELRQYFRINENETA